MNPMDDRREAAIRRLKAKRELRAHVAVYVAVNALLIVIWASTGGGYFWPIWPLMGWGIGLAAHAYSTMSDRPITESDIQAEMGRDGPQDTPRY